MAAKENDNDKTQTCIILPKGTMVSHYRIADKIGSGGMGEVYRAIDTKLNRIVALKFLPSHLCQDEDFRKRFKREAQAAAKLNHPNVVHIYEVSEYKGWPFFAMELIEGQSLSEIIKGNELQLDFTIDLVMQVCAGLREAHGAGIVHRDIKPSNIILDRNNRPKLLDFGLATIKGNEKLTKTGLALGTIGYMSPEQVKGETADARSDIFSLGVVLYEMVTGQQPFRRDSEAATLHAIVNDSPKPIARKRSDVPDVVQQIVDRALEKNRETRYRNVDDYLVDLRFLKNQIDSGLSKARIRLPYRGRPLVRRSVIGTLIMVSLILLLSLSSSTRHMILKWFGTGQAQATTHIAVLPFTDLGETTASQSLCAGLMETLTSKLTQLEQFHGSLWVVPASEVRQREIVSARQAQRVFGASLAVTGSVQLFNGDVRLTLNLVDTKSERQLKSSIIDDSLINISSLQDSIVIRMAEMLAVQLNPDERIFLTSGKTASQDAYRHYLQALGYLSYSEREENVDTAIGLFRQAIEEDPEYALAYAGLGRAYWYKYQISTDPLWEKFAIRNSQRAIDLYEQSAPVHITLGGIYQGKGQYEMAIQEYENALEIDSVSREAYSGLAASYQALNQLAQAESTYKKVIELKPDYWVGYVNLGLFYAYHGRHEDALIQLEHVVKFDHEGYDAWNNLGGLYYGLGYLDEAGTMWERSLEIEPNYGAYSNLGTLYYMEQNFADAARMYRRALELDDYDYRVWMGLASAFHQIPDETENALVAYDRTIQIAEEQLKINPQNPEVLSHLADCYAVTGEHDRAFLLMQQALSLAPNNTDIMVTAGFIYEQLGFRDTALLWITEALNRGFPKSQIESLPEMQGLVADPRYQQLHQTDSI